jgi:hypothetical protein
MTDSNILSSKQKALKINLEESIYGTFAEIGAGQEVARNFFQAGGASGTVAKTMSAYDMVVSDAIYGKEESGRYVSESRLHNMLDKEYEVLIERLAEIRGSKTKFFVFADTVAAKSFKGVTDCHGWIGVKFQHVPGAKPSEAILHVQMLDNLNLQQYEALGSIGVNLIFSCFFNLGKASSFVKSLMENLSSERIEIDMIRVSGPAFKGVDSRLLSLELVNNKYTNCAYFDETGRVQQASEKFYKKNIIITRGSFRPPTLLNVDMIQTGLKAFLKEIPKEEHSQVLSLAEISMNKLLDRGKVDSEDFLARVDLLASLGQKVLISNHNRYFGLNQSLLKWTKKNIAFNLGVYNLEQILDENGKENEELGPLESIGRLTGKRTKLYVYPASEWDQGSGKSEHLITSQNIKISDDMQLIYQFLKNKNLMEDILDFDVKVTSIWSRKVLKMIQEGDKNWEKMVPKEVIKLVKEKKLFGSLEK